MKIVFIDPKCPKPYDTSTLANEGLGGTEATVVRVARELSNFHDVAVLQHNRTQALAAHERLRFLPMAATRGELVSADHVIFVQRAQGLRQLRSHTKGRFWIWLHNFVGDEVPWFWQDHVRTRLGIICVSRHHAEHTMQHIRSSFAGRLSAGWVARGGVCYQYNPLDRSFEGWPTTAKDPNKLVFFSSPHKGLDQVIRLFGELRKRRPSLELHVANPGYLAGKHPELLQQPGVRTLGTLRGMEVAHHVSNARFVFYPQTRRPETFGLVLAEAHAVGTAVLAHDFGAAREVLGPSNPPINATDASRVLDTAEAWLGGACPPVGIDERFTTDRVIAGWLSFLEAPDALVAQQAIGLPERRRQP